MHRLLPFGSAHKVSHLLDALDLDLGQMREQDAQIMISTPGAVIVRDRPATDQYSSRNMGQIHSVTWPFATCGPSSLVKVGTPKYKVNRGLTVDQARDVLKAAQNERLYALYVLALCLGLRRGELLGLRWDDVTLVGCRACDGEGGEVDGAECRTYTGSGVESATLEVVQTRQRVGGALRFFRPRLNCQAARDVLVISMHGQVGSVLLLLDQEPNRAVSNALDSLLSEGAKPKVA